MCSSDLATPEWVQQGTGAFNVEAGKQLHGVGSAIAADPKARRQQADQAAQQQLTGGVDALAAALAKMSESTDSVADTVSGIARKAASQASGIRDHWVTPDGTEQSLDVLDLAAFKQALQSVDGDEKIRREMASNADKAFDSLAKQ